jgi:hypothetical protein
LAPDLAEGGGQAIKDQEPAEGATERRRRAPGIELNFASPSRRAGTNGAVRKLPPSLLSQAISSGLPKGRGTNSLDPLASAARKDLGHSAQRGEGLYGGRGILFCAARRAADQRSRKS